MPPTKSSPLMEQYYQNKKLYPDALLLFRVGDFYETFADDAVIVARDLNITLTSRQKDDQGEKIPLAGVPYHSLDVYLARLIRAGHKVAICDQVEDPKLARGLVKRAITRVVTPGTIIEPSMLEES
ncbi:MAG: DNA mismatch repair protein MutS, partial [Methanothrix sp.]